jgi:ubiquinone/menaquinone biosynthesis C-methylase UbiE
MTEPERATRLARRRYDRIAWIYDALEGMNERISPVAAWRQQTWSRVSGRVLEIGIGTGRNIPYHPPHARVTGIDLSARMLARARQFARRLGVPLDLRVMDAEQLEFPDGAFDAAVATFVFCSVPQPLDALREAGRVVRPGGDIWLLEHVRIDRPFIGRLMDVLNPLAVRLTGANINRRTVQNVGRAGLEVLSVESLKGDLVKLIHARPR